MPILQCAQAENHVQRAPIQANGTHDVRGPPEDVISRAFIDQLDPQ
jgi:hypothetical protein